VDGTGFEPATSAMPTPGGEGAAFGCRHTNPLSEFDEFLRVNLQLRPSTVQHTVQDVQRFLRFSKSVVSYDTISSYLRAYLSKAPKTYNGQIVSLRRFIKEFLKRPTLIESFKLTPVDDIPQTEVPTRKKVREGFKAQKDTRAKAIYLFTATTGLRKGEILELTKDKVDLELRTIIPRHFTRKKRSGVTFINEEAQEWLRKYLEQRDGDGDPRLFVISDRKWREIWRRAGLTSKELRVWFSTEMGELAVPDRYVDVFQGRAPRSVLAKHYTGKGLERLKRIYDKAKIKVLI
jgi:integrase